MLYEVAKEWFAMILKHVKSAHKMLYLQDGTKHIVEGTSYNSFALVDITHTVNKPQESINFRLRLGLFHAVLHA